MAMLSSRVQWNRALVFPLSGRLHSAELINKHLARRGQWLSARAGIQTSQDNAQWL